MIYNRRNNNGNKPMGRPKGGTLSSEKVAEILNTMAEKTSVNQVLKSVQTSTTTVYKLVEDFPLWSYQFKKGEEDA